MQIVQACDLFNWTYEEYMNQPNWFVALRIGKRSVEAKLSNKKK